MDYIRLDCRDLKSRPADFADRFKPGKYDVYILGDVDSTAFQGDELARLAECVNRGAGLIAIGGFQAFGPGGYLNTPLAGVLPVGMDRLERQRPDEPARGDLHWPGPLRMRPTPLGLGHFSLMLAAGRRENDALWSSLPPLEGANKFHDLAPGAVVLADAGDDKPLLVAHDFGAGRVMAFAGDSTWRWWMHGYESAFKRFWRQTILWLAARIRVKRAACGFGRPADAYARRTFGFFGGRQFTDGRADRRRRLQGRNRFARRRPAADPLGPSGRTNDRLVYRHAIGRRLCRRSDGRRKRPTAGHGPGAISRVSTRHGTRQRLGRRLAVGESRRGHRRRVAAARAVARTDPAIGAIPGNSTSSRRRKKHFGTHGRFS